MYDDIPYYLTDIHFDLFIIFIMLFIRYLGSFSLFIDRREEKDFSKDVRFVLTIFNDFS